MLVKQRTAAFFATVLLSLVFSSGADAQSPINVKLGLSPIVTVAPVFLAQQQGFFKEEGLNVQTHMFQGGAEATAALIGGELDITYSNLVTQLLAHARGAPVRIVAPSDIASTAPGALVDALLVKPDSTIAGFKALEGKRVAVNLLKGVLELLTRASVDHAGGDSSKLILVEVPFPQMRTVLTSGQVDAVVNVEPFITAMVESGSAKVAGDPLVSIENGPLGVWISTVEKANNRDLRERFRRAMGKANNYASRNPAEVRKITPTFTKISAEAAAKMSLPVWSDKLDVATMQHQADLMLKYKFIPARINAADTIAR
jgi:ABC-type nitrate/sulfonate/bicarbonate transport system substrate-binding protein